MARAAFRLYEMGDDAGDLRVPIAYALIDLYGLELPDVEIVRYVEHLLPIEQAGLQPRAHAEVT